jgi:hypothetical protein
MGKISTEFKKKTTKKRSKSMPKNILEKHKTPTQKTTR